MASKQYPYTRKTLEAFRKAGRHAWKVEWWNPYGMRRVDTFGFIDILVIDPFEGIVAVQVCSATGHAEHRRKILRNDYAARWVNFAKIELWSWRYKKLKRGGVAVKIVPRTEVITKEMFADFAALEKIREPKYDVSAEDWKADDELVHDIGKDS